MLRRQRPPPLPIMRWQRGSYKLPRPACRIRSCAASVRPHARAAVRPGAMTPAARSV